MPGFARAVHRGHADSRNSPAKSRQAKGAAPRYSTSLCPRLDIGKRPATNRRQTTNGWQLPRCFLAPRAQLGIHALIAQRLSLYAICATAREQIAPDVDGTRGHL